MLRTFMAVVPAEAASWLALRVDAVAADKGGRFSKLRSTASEGSGRPATLGKVVHKAYRKG